MTETKLLARRELDRRAALWELARRDPLFLVSFMSAVDEGDGSRFSFEHVRWPLEPGEVQMAGDRDMGSQDSWRWQRLVGEMIVNSKRFMGLKGRQIGLTWVWLAVDVAEAILMPGTTSVVYRQKEADAIDAIRRWWVLYRSLPEMWTGHIKTLTPDRGHEPGRDGVKLLFPNGDISRVLPMTSSQSSGHGKTLRRALADEAAHIEYLGSIKKAVEPAAEQGTARIGYISTANGVSNPETGEGNRFHYDWVNAGTGVTRLFLPYSVHPNRDEEWYEQVPRGTLGLTEQEVNEQYPRNEHEAFALTTRTFIPPDVLKAYRTRIGKTLRRYDFVKAGPRTAKIEERSDGAWTIYREPDRERRYAIGADPATARGLDSSAAFVIDLSDMALVAQYRARVDADLFAFQLHYAGRRYNNALLAVEVAGGYGDAVIIPLRDGREGRPAYPNLYRHVMSSRPDQPIAKPYGFPTNVKTRPLITNHLQRVLREHELPWVTDDLQYELENFVNADTNPTPRAAEGHHDDLVMACAIALEMYRLRGAHPDMRRPTRRNWLVPA